MKYSMTGARFNIDVRLQATKSGVMCIRVRILLLKLFSGAVAVNRCLRNAVHKLESNQKMGAHCGRVVFIRRDGCDRSPYAP